MDIAGHMKVSVAEGENSLPKLIKAVEEGESVTNRRHEHRIGLRQGPSIAPLNGLRQLEDLSIDEVIEQFDVTREQVTAVLDFVARSLRVDPVPTGAHPL